MTCHFCPPNIGHNCPHKRIDVGESVFTMHVGDRRDEGVIVMTDRAGEFVIVEPTELYEAAGRWSGGAKESHEAILDYVVRQAARKGIEMHRDLLERLAKR